MTPKFTTPCFIRKNTPELRKKLEELGYTILFSVRNGCGGGIRTCGGYASSTKAPNNADIIDCGENERLFLALAALREDSDRFQWFCDDNGLWEMGESDLPSRYMQMNGHKATPDELISYFRSYPPSALTN